MAKNWEVTLAQPWRTPLNRHEDECKMTCIATAYLGPISAFKRLYSLYFRDTKSVALNEGWS